MKKFENQSEFGKVGRIKCSGTFFRTRCIVSVAPFIAVSLISKNTRHITPNTPYMSTSFIMPRLELTMINVHTKLEMHSFQRCERAPKFKNGSHDTFGGNLSCLDWHLSGSTPLPNPKCVASNHPFRRWNRSSEIYKGHVTLITPFQGWFYPWTRYDVLWSTYKGDENVENVGGLEYR